MINFIPFLIFGFFLILIFLGIPVAYSMIVTSLMFVIFMGKGLGSLIVPFSRLGLGFSFSLLAIFFFIELGCLMNETKISDYIVDFIRQLGSLLIKKDKSGLTGAITILACTACGPMTGSVAGTTSAVGSVMIPQMNKLNYDPKYSSTLLAYSGILGSLIPPSISGLVYAVVVGLPVLGVWLSVCGVGLLYAFVLLVVNRLISKKNGYETSESATNLVSISKINLKKSFIKSLPALLIPLSVFGSIYTGIATPTEAGAVGALGTLLLGVLYYKTIRSFKHFTEILYKSSYQTSVIMFLICASFSLSYALTSTGAIKSIVVAMLLITENKYLLFLITQALLLILGCFLDDAPIMILLGPIASSILIPIGIHPYHLSAVFVFVCLVGLVTPPVGTALYVASSVSKVSVNNMVKYIVVFFIPALVVLIIITFFPSISFAIPKLFGLL